MKTHILCVDDDTNFLVAIKAILAEQYQVTTVCRLDECLAVLRSTHIDVVLLDFYLDESNGIESLLSLKAEFPSTSVVILSGHKDPRSIVDAIRNGADDYLVKNNSDELLATIEKVQKKRDVEDRCGALVKAMNDYSGRHTLLGEAKNFVAVLQSATKMKGHQANVLIEGESGTGKELFARYIHRLENQDRRPFIAVNCAAIPDALMESELFGHEKGSFSGATERKIGKFELAHGGDLFLDEINSLKPEMQAKLLRALQEQEFYRVGGDKLIRVNIRVISASNANLQKSIATGQMREDLYHRLKVVNLQIPPLRERSEDIPLLVDHFLKKLPQPNGRKVITREALQVLITYKWPGNVRELEHILSSASVMSDDVQYIAPYHLPIPISQQYEDTSIVTIQDDDMVIEDQDFRMMISDFGMPISKMMRSVREQYAKQVVAKNHGNKAKASQILGISRPTLYKMLTGEKILN